MSIPTAAERAIRRQIARHGAITFSEYMARALYGPGGYYSRHNAGADYYTSPQVHPAFGALLTVHLFHLWTLLDRPRPFTILEPGAGNGLLCGDILATAAYLPDGFHEAVRYIACDLRAMSGRERGEAQTHRIVADALRLPLRGGIGCVISNELLDALPVHRVRMESSNLRELYVDVESDVADGYEGQLVERVREPSTPLLERRLVELGIELSEGQTAEICLLLEDWALSVASVLDRGFALTIDYGRSAVDLYDPGQRPHGTLVTYRAHRQTDSPLEETGRQDITAQVDFTSAQSAGERAGLITVGNVAQGAYLSRLGLQALRRNHSPPDQPASGWITLPVGPNGLPPDSLPEPVIPSSDDGRDWLTGLTHLARPGGLGDFRVLVQAKGVPTEPATAALHWLDGQPASHGYSPAELAAMIPACVLRLGPEHFRFG
ncbi:MAG: SAM-dependent methyltransferase [Dehalococcoidia bacterium]|nr:SAM-dependent methyltransferase [Dehalococcoidia bacterium]